MHLYTTKREMGLNRTPPPLHLNSLNCHIHFQPSHSYSWTVTHPFNCHSLNHHTLTILPHQPLYTVPDSVIRWSSNDDSVIILQAPHRTSVIHQFCSDTQRFAVPDLQWVKGKKLSQYHTNDYNLQVNFIMPWLLPRQNIASFPGIRRGAPDSHSLHIHAPQDFLGNFELSILVCVQWPYINESQESLHL